MSTSVQIIDSIYGLPFNHEATRMALFSHLLIDFVFNAFRFVMKLNFQVTEKASTFLLHCRFK